LFSLTHLFRTPAMDPIKLSWYAKNVLPGIYAKAKGNLDTIKKGIVASLKVGEEEIPVVNEQGETVEIDQIILVGAPAMEDPQADPAADPSQADPAQASLRAMADAAVAKALADYAKPTKVKVPFQAPPASHTKGTVPAKVKRYGPVRSFKGTDADYKAFKLGAWFAAINGKDWGVRWCKDHGIEVKAHQEGVNTSGGFLFPEQFENDMIDLRLEFGVFRRRSHISPMTSDTRSDPRRTGGLTATFAGESVAATESTKGWDRVTLTAKKLVAISRISSELAEDAVINIGDDLASEIAYAFSEKEDQAGFNGDGTSTYGGITGVNTRLTDVNGVDNGGGLVLGAGNLFSELTLANFHNLVGILPTFARSGAWWYASPLFFNQVMEKLMIAAGGTTPADIANGGTNRFMGYPVELTEVMPTTDANSQVAVLFGDLTQASSFGDRRQTTIATSEHATIGSVNVFESDEMAVRGTERFDINVHDVGTATAAGPIVGLITAAA